MGCIYRSHYQGFQQPFQLTIEDPDLALEVDPSEGGQHYCVERDL